jgi:NADPH-dependent 2,4-dienoyl-CoA reductase/sulfur reductase-like enzyme
MAEFETTYPYAESKRKSQAPDVLQNGSVVSVETDLLIIGAGPAGAALACFLAQNGKTSP